MPLPEKLKKEQFDTLPDFLKTDYEEDGGEYVRKDDGAAKALADERTKREAAERLAKKAADELKKEQDKSKAKTHGLTEEQLTALREEAVKDEREKREAAERELAEERTKIRQKDIGLEFKTLAGGQKFKAEKLDDLYRLHGDEFDLTTDNKLMVKGKPGVDPVKHMEAIAKTRLEWVQGTQAAGGGAAGVTTGGGGTGTLTADDLLKNPGLGFDTPAK